MDVFDGRQWHRDWLDPWCGPDACRLAVQRAFVLGPVTGAYFVPPRDWRRVWNYVSEIGPREVARKIISRRREALRNDKYVSLVQGTVLQAAQHQGSPQLGTPVLALCLLHPFASERLVVHTLLVRTETLDLGPVASGTLETARAAMAPRADGALAHLAGWHPESGRTLDTATVDEAFREAIAAARSHGPQHWTAHVVPGSTVAEQAGSATTARTGARRVALFGYGQYAKTIIVPNLDTRLALAAIHEVDPAQLATARGAAPILDTSPLPRDDSRYDVYFAAGYHHTHATIAGAALALGASAIIEKPPVTTRAQLEVLLALWRSRGGAMYTCFQRRYASFTTLARQDLAEDGALAGTPNGPPVSYRCLVYEVPLPPLHWYRWPTSRGRIVSNGCHWIDHFLFVNDYAKVVRFDGWTARNGDSVCMAELENGASFSMALTDQGSDCIGMQNVIELRAGSTSVRIVNDGDYRCEGRRGLKNRKRQNKMDAFVAMYRTISSAAVEQRPLDTPDALAATAGLMLDLDALVTGHLPDAEAC
jgi:predicted dehydrogenase